MTDLIQNTRALFEDSIAVKQAILDGDMLDQLAEMAKDMAAILEKGGKLMFCGNGGSAADAQHLAAELSIRFRSSVNRQALAAIPLAMDPSSITACGNDYGFEDCFSRMVEALGQEGDAVIGLTTSGSSANVLRAFEAAKKKNIACYGFLGGSGKPAIDLCDAAFLVPSDVTARIQESHITAGHALMEMIEDILLESGFISLT